MLTIQPKTYSGQKMQIRENKMTSTQGLQKKKNITHIAHEMKE
jgi:hypothetical protein